MDVEIFKGGNNHSTWKKQGMTQGTIDIVSLVKLDKACGERLNHGLPANFGQPDCECRHCQQNRRSDHRLIINHGPWKPSGKVELTRGKVLAANEVNRVSLPGDVDYAPEYILGYSGIGTPVGWYQAKGLVQTA